jgi:hypothetical protein
MSTVTDFHQLDRCSCGGTLDAWTTRYTKREREKFGIINAYFRTNWICQRCGEESDQFHDVEMNDISNAQAAGMEK